MHKQAKDSRNKIDLKRYLRHRYVDVFLAFFSVMILGVLLATSATAQFDQMPGQSGFPGDSATSTPDGFNQKPTLSGLVADRSGPQVAGTSIKWTAMALDPDGDQIQFMFRLKGPSTGGEWQPVSGWSNDNTWTWVTSAATVGNNQIAVWIRDGKHADAENFDDQATESYQINEPELPAEPAQPAQTQTEAPVETGQTSGQVFEPPAAAAPVETAPENQPPVMGSLTSSPSSPSSPQEAGAVITWTAEASDPEGDLLQFTFLVDGKTGADWSQNPTWTWSTTNSDVGSHSIEVKVRDGQHNPEGDASRTAGFTITAPNQKPSITGFGPDKASPQDLGATVTWTAEASDPDGDPVLFRFFAGGLPVTDWQPQGQWTWTTSNANVGENQIEVQVRDGKHAEQYGFDDSRSASFTIAAPNQKPAIINFNADKLSPQDFGSSIVWTVEVMDSENDPIQYRFFLNGQPVTDWQPQAQWTWTTSNANVGENQVAVSIIDGKHAGQDSSDDSKTAAFTITAPNQKPAITSLEPDKAAPQEAGAIVTWTAQASDPENDPIQYRFFLNGQPVTDWQPQNQWAWTSSNANVGENQVAVSIIDGKHAGQDSSDDSKTAAFTITAPNQKPAITSLEPDKAAPQEAGAIVTWTAQASDPENDPIQYRFFLNGQPVTDWQPQNQWAWTSSNANVGENQVAVSIIDGKHAGQDSSDDSKTAAFTIAAPNQKPAITSLEPDKAAPQESDATVTWTAQASDPENDPIQYRFFLNGQPVTDWQPQNQWAWTSSNANVGENQVAVSIIDGKHAGQDSSDDSKSATFTIAAPNQKPSITSLEPDKAGPQILGSTVTWTALASDAENDPLLFRFLVNSTPATDWQPQAQWAWTAAEVGASQIEVQVRDDKHADVQGFDDSKSASFSIVAPAPQAEPAKPEVVPEVVPEVAPKVVAPAKLNESPSIADLAADLSSPQILGTVITWTAIASDPENDPISYRFLLNGTPVADWQTSNQWTWTPTEAGTSQIMVQVKDDKHDAPQGESGNASAEFTINSPAPQIEPSKPEGIAPVKLNESPSISGLAADLPSPQLVGSVITWTAVASDPENDPISYRFLLNGTPVADWQTSNQWTWTPTEVGTSQIMVQVKDDKHDAAQGEGGNASAEFTINSPAPQIEPSKPEVVPEVIAPVKLNESPSISGLAADLPSPQLVGSVITWTAAASDPENDPISYRFLLNGTPVADWQTSNQWTWTPTEAGTSQIMVQVKDDKHDAPQGESGNASAEFAVNAPVIEEKPAEETTVPATPATENVTIPAAENVTIPAAENATKPEEQMPGNATPPGMENVTAPEVPANVTEPLPANETVTPTPSPTPLAENQTPIINSLTPDKASPQIPGTSVTWSANATDADKDPVLYRFFLNGPATGNAWQPETDWSATNAWTWSTTSADAGENQIRVWIRDGKHAAEDSFDGESLAYFSLVQPSRNISGMTYNDKNGNGQKDSGEDGLSGWTIQLVKPDNSEVGVLTKDDGSYLFEHLTVGAYTIKETLPSGWKATNPESGSIAINLKDIDATGNDFANKLTSYSISGIKFNDLNGDGAKAGEPGLAGWTIQLSKDGSEVNTTTTGQDGSYKFEDLAPGSYSVKEVDQTGWIRTTPADGSFSVELTNADVTDRDFGNHGSWSISGTAFQDTDGNGAKDGEETGLAGWSIQLSKDGSTVNATTTAADGSYKFANLVPGTYALSEVAKEGWEQTVPQGSYTVELTNADVTGKDFGNRGNLSISGQKYYDVNGNGVQDADEPGIPGGSVSLVENGKVVANTTTDENGMYSFKGILPGTYTINDPVPGGLILTTSSTITVTITSSVVLKANFGIVGPYSISGMKFNDIDGDGLKGGSEGGVSGWDMVLTGTTWFGKPLPARTTTTGADGSYKFEKLLPGTYKVSETSRTGWTQTAPTSGSHDISFPFGSAPTESKDNNFGNRVVAQSISGVKYNDLNGNGMRDAGEPGMAGWTINLEQPAGTVIQTKSTAADGSYIFTSLAAGTYAVSEVLQPGWTQKAPAGGKHTVILDAATTSATGKDFGNYIPMPTNPTLVPDKSSPQKAGTPIIWTAGATSSEPLQYRFFVKGPAPSSALRADTGYSANNVWTWSTVGYLAGTYQIEVWIRDGKHAGPSGFDVKKTVTFALTSPNLPPVVNLLFADRPAPQIAGSWIKWTALATDPEGDPLQYKFYLRGPSTGGFWMDQTGWGKNNRWIWRTNPLDVGYSEVLVAVRDGKHAGPGGSDDYDVASYSIIILNQPPVITSLGTSTPSPQPVGATVWWSATAMDPEGNPVFYRYWIKGPATSGIWKIARDWSTDPTWSWPTSIKDAGTSEIQLQVRDGYHSGPAGWDDDAGALFTVLKPNQPPKLISLLPNKPSPQSVGTAVKWTATASDPDAEMVLYKFWLKGPGTGNAWKSVQDWSTKNQWTWTSAPTNAGAYTVYVYARDGKHSGAGGYDSALGAPYVLLNNNQPPKLTALVPDKKSPQSAGTAVKWTATATDANKEPILYRFWLKGPSTGNTWKNVQDWSTKNQWTWTSTPADVGSYSVYVYARDGMHAPATGYDSALGQSYALSVPPVKSLDKGSLAGAMPSLVFTGDGYLLAFQSTELGVANQGDVAMQKLDPNWNKQKSIWVANSKANESAPSLISSGGYYYVAYASAEKGNRDIFVKKFDGSLKLLDTKQLTASPANEDSPSLIAVGSNFLLAYQSWSTGIDSGGDIFLNKYDLNWKLLGTEQLTDQKSYQDRPSLAYAEGNFYVAYVSRETGNLDIFQKKLDGNLEILETRKLTLDKSDQDYPSLKWMNGQFMLLYASKKTGGYEIMLDRYLRDGKSIDSSVVVAAPSDQTSSSLAYSSLDGKYWVAYTSKDAAGRNIYVKSLKLANPGTIKPCDIAASFSATKAASPYVLTLKFYNNYGELWDPDDLSLSWNPQDAASQKDNLQRISVGTYQLKSVFGAKGDKSFKIGATIDGCLSAKIVPVKVV